MLLLQIDAYARGMLRFHLWKKQILVMSIFIKNNIISHAVEQQKLLIRLFEIFL